jgi:hypothetical protein
LRIRNWTQTGKGNYTRALCQNNEGSVEIKQRPIRTGGRTIYSTGNRNYTRALCQNNEGSVEIKQRPIRMGGRTIYRTLSPKSTRFELGLTDDPTCEMCIEEDESATHILSDCEATVYLRFRHLGQFFMESSDHYDAPINKVLYFIQSVGLIKG